MTFLLQSLIKEAKQQLGNTDCHIGRHDWITDGGRSCPEDIDEHCSQPVYICRSCGEIDYGDNSKYPGAQFCERSCVFR